MLRRQERWLLRGDGPRLYSSTGLLRSIHDQEEDYTEYSGKSHDPPAHEKELHGVVTLCAVWEAGGIDQGVVNGYEFIDNGSKCYQN